MSTTTVLIMTPETGLFLSFGSIVFMLLFIIILYMFWDLKRRKSMK